MNLKTDPIWTAYCLQCHALHPTPLTYDEAEQKRDEHAKTHNVVGIQPSSLVRLVQTVPGGPWMMNRRTALLKIADERERQDKLKADGRFVYTCADPEADHGQCLAILLEEIGEVGESLTFKLADPSWSSLALAAANLGETARSLLNQKGYSTDPPHHRPDRDTRKELVQCAAVILAWLEGFEEKKS